MMLEEITGTPDYKSEGESVRRNTKPDTDFTKSCFPKLSGLSEQRLLFMTKPAAEKARSLVSEVAGVHSIARTVLLRRGNCSARSAHHCRGSGHEAVVTRGSERYCSISSAPR